MRAYEFLLEDDSYVNEINSAITDLLATSRANGITNISTQKLVQTLNSMGYNVTPEAIISVLENNPFVETADPEMITISSGQKDAEGSENSAEDNRAKVKDLAQKAAEKDIK